MKKLIAFLAALTLLCSLGMMVFADDGIQTFPGQTSESEGKTQLITTEVPATTWTLIIPADCHIPYRTEEMAAPG